MGKDEHCGSNRESSFYLTYLAEHFRTIHPLEFVYLYNNISLWSITVNLDTDDNEMVIRITFLLSCVY